MSHVDSGVLSCLCFYFKFKQSELPESVPVKPFSGAKYMHELVCIRVCVCVCVICVFTEK